MLPVYFTARSLFKVLAQVQTTNSDEKVIRKKNFGPDDSNEPVRIVEVLANSRVVKPDVSFEDKGEWLKDLTIKFKNVSKKTITHVDWNLGFPQTKTETPPMGYSLVYGLYYSKQAPDAAGMKYLAPGETAEVTLDDTSFQGMKKFVAKKKDLNDLSIVDLTLLVVYFDDGSQWSAGKFFRPDPGNPGKFIPNNNQQPTD